MPIAFLCRCPVSLTILGSPLQFRLQAHSFTINLLRSTSQGIQTCYIFPVLKRFLFIGILVQASGTTESCVFLYLKKKEKYLDQSVTTILSHGCSDLCVPEWLDSWKTSQWHSLCVEYSSDTAFAKGSPSNTFSVLNPKACDGQVLPVPSILKCTF